jgi:hypothetical protein
MRLPPAILGNTEEVLREVLRFTSPADVTLSRYFKDHPRFGGRERGVIAEAVYAVLRNKSFFTDFAGAGNMPSMRKLALLGLSETVGIECPRRRDRRRNTSSSPASRKSTAACCRHRCRPTCRPGCTTSWSPSSARKKPWRWPPC